MASEEEGKEFQDELGLDLELETESKIESEDMLLGNDMPADGMGVPGNPPPEDLSYEVPVIETPKVDPQMARLAEAGFKPPEGIENVKPKGVDTPGGVVPIPRDLANPGPAPAAKLQTAQQSNVAKAVTAPVNNDTMAGAQALAEVRQTMGNVNPQPVSPSPGQPVKTWQEKAVAKQVYTQPIAQPQADMAQLIQQAVAQAMQQLPQPVPQPPQPQPVAQGGLYEPQPGLIAYDPNNFPVGMQLEINRTRFEVTRHNIHYTKLVIRAVV